MKPKPAKKSHASPEGKMAQKTGTNVHQKEKFTIENSPAKRKNIKKSLKKSNTIPGLSIDTKKSPNNLNILSKNTGLNSLPLDETKRDKKIKFGTKSQPAYQKVTFNKTAPHILNVVSIDETKLRYRNVGNVLAKGSIISGSSKVCKISTFEWGKIINKTIICSHCCFSTLCARTLIMHVYAQHTKSQKVNYYCPFCPSKYESEKLYIEHLANIHKKYSSVFRNNHNGILKKYHSYPMCQYYLKLLKGMPQKINYISPELCAQIRSSVKSLSVINTSTVEEGKDDDNWNLVLINASETPVIKDEPINEEEVVEINSTDFLFC